MSKTCARRCGITLVALLLSLTASTTTVATTETRPKTSSATTAAAANGEVAKVDKPQDRHNNLVSAATTPTTTTNGASDQDKVKKSQRVRLLQDETSCVTAGCGTTGTCSDSIDLGCDAPDEFVCEHDWPGYNVCESPPVSTMQPCWMWALDDGVALNEISIPATHDTMSKGSSACLQDGIGDLVYTQVRVCVYLDAQYPVGCTGYHTRMMTSRP